MDKPPVPPRIGGSRPMGPRPMEKQAPAHIPEKLSQARIRRKPVGTASTPVLSYPEESALPERPASFHKPMGPRPYSQGSIESHSLPPYPVSPPLMPTLEPVLKSAPAPKTPYPESGGFPDAFAPSSMDVYSSSTTLTPVPPYPEDHSQDLIIDDFEYAQPDASWSHPEILNPQHTLNLPSIPPLTAQKVKFSAEYLSVAEFEACENIALLSSLGAWANFLNHSVDAILSLDSLLAAFAKLFTYNIPLLSWVSAEAVARQVVTSLQQQGFVWGTEDIVLHPEAPVSGVVPLLSRNGCYASHGEACWNCYSGSCLKETKAPTAKLVRQGSLKVKEGHGLYGLFEPDWAAYWGLHLPEITPIIKHQFAIHELIYTESLYLHDLDTFLSVYGVLESQRVMSRQTEFYEGCFERVREIIKHQKVLFARLKAKQSHGPYVESIAEIVRDWALAAKDAYIAYSGDYIWTDRHLRKEMGNSQCEKWFAQAGRDPRLKGKPFQFFFNRVIPRALRYKLLLEAIKKHANEQEKVALEAAIEAANAIGVACDTAVDKATKAEELQNINATIVFRDTSIEVDLRLEDSRRKLLRRGKMIRRSGTGIEWLESDVLLLDNYLILAKMREGANGASIYITKKPIYLELLVLDSQDEEPVTNFSFLSGFSGAVNAANSMDERIHEELAIYPIRITAQGTSYTLYTTSQIEREHWCKAMLDAKKAITANQLARNSVPFSFKNLSDAFAYPDYYRSNLPVACHSAVMARCIGEAPAIITARGRINCVCAFLKGYFVGLEYGLYYSANEGWTKCLNIPVADVRVVPELNFVLVLSRGALIWYRLDEVVARALEPYTKKGYPMGRRITSRVQSFELSFTSRLQILYSTGKKDVFSLEPIRCKTSIPAKTNVQASKDLMGAALNTVEIFRPTETFSVLHGDVLGITPFTRSFVAHTSKGFECVQLDSKFSHRIPSNNVVLSSGAASAAAFGPALAIYRVSAKFLVLCYHTCAALCSNEGILSLPLTKYLMPATSVAFSAPYLIVVSPELVEIRRIEQRKKARLVQVMTGTDIRLMGTIEGQVRLAMAHPEYNDRQLLVELVCNEFVALDDSSSLVTL